MAIEGNLQDMSLPNIMQIICLEQRKIGLHLKRQSEKGSIFFDRGEIVHATVGTLEGEEAIYHLLRWSDGDFRTSNEMTIAHRTIAMRWDQLLMEGMKRIDERERDRHNSSISNSSNGNGSAASAAAKQATLSKAEMERDSELENDLLQLLSELEHSQTRLREKSVVKRPVTGLQIIAEMANKVVEFSETRPERNKYVDALEKTLAEMVIEYPAAHVLEPQQKRLPVQSAIGMYNNASNQSRGKVFHDLSQSIISIIKTYFVLLTSAFYSPTTAEEIKEAYTLFLNDLNSAVSGLNP